MSAVDTTSIEVSVGTISELAARLAANEILALGSGCFIERTGRPLTDERPAGMRFATIASPVRDVAPAESALSGRERVLTVPTKPLPRIAPWASIGRLARCSVPLNDASVSKLHALVRYSNGRFYVADAGSRNGTRLNGVAIARYDTSNGELLKSGDNLTLGSVRLLFFYEKDLLAVLKTYAPDTR